MEGFSTAPQLSSAPVVTTIVAGTNVTIEPIEGIGSVTINAPGSGPGGGVLTLAGLEGTITLSSPDNSITITPDGQDIALTLGGSVVTSVAAGTGISVDASTGDVTITNTGVTNLTDGTTSSASVITLAAGTAMSVVNSAGTFTIANTGVTELTGGSGIGISAQTGSVTISNIGVASLVPGEYINVTQGEAHAWTIDNTGVQTFNSYTGAVTISGGAGIELGGTEPDIEISNSGVTEAVAGDGISVSAGTGSVTIGNTGVISLAAITGEVTLSATGLTITPSGQNIDFAVTAGAVSSVNAQTGAVLIDAGDGIAVTITETPSINIANSGVLSVVAGTGITLTGDTPQNPTINVPVYQATYYKTATQNLTSGNTDITFDGVASWSVPNGYITHTSGTTDFNVVTAGLYQLEFNATILPNGATWTTTTNKGISIDITRSPTAEQGILPQFALIASGTQYSQSVCATFNLAVGDVINCRVTNTFTGGPAQAQFIQNTFDLNTWFTWRYIGAGAPP